MKVIEKVRNLIKDVIQGELSDKCYFVGGCVRDYILGKDPNDIDIVVNVRKGSRKLVFAIKNKYRDQVTQPCRLGHYPIWSITFKEDIEGSGIQGLTLEIAETMKEEFHDVNSRQRYVEFSTLEDDVLRRDFSVNSGLINIQTGKVINQECLEDIKQGIIRCNSGVNKDKIFSDDPLRILRGVIFSIRFDWKIEKETEEAMIRNASRLKIVAQERINKELEKVFNLEEGIYKLINSLNRLDLLRYIFPHINNQKEVYQWNITSKNEFKPDSRGIHLEGYTVFDHTLEVLKYTKYGWINGWCALFHDIGKTNFTRQQLSNHTISFLGHDESGAKYVKNILHRVYKLDNETVDIVSFVCKYHMRIYKLLDSGDKAKRRFLRETNKEHRKYLYDLCNADTLGNKKNKGASYSMLTDDFIKNLESLGEYILQANNKKKNLLNGNEIMKLFDLKPGKSVGILISKLEDLQDEYGENLTKEQAIEFLKNEYKNISKDCCYKMEQELSLIYNEKGEKK